MRQAMMQKHAWTGNRGDPDFPWVCLVCKKSAITPSMQDHCAGDPLGPKAEPECANCETLRKQNNDLIRLCEHLKRETIKVDRERKYGSPTA